MIRIYGIKNCDIVQKALKWLDAEKVAYEFHNYKESGIDEATLLLWLKHIPANKLINARSTTFRELPENEKEGMENIPKAIGIMRKHTSVIKRPVWDLGNGTFFAGWDEKEIDRLLKI